MVDPQAETLKAEGNELFKSAQYQSALTKYKEAIRIDPTVAAYWSNAAGCYAKLGRYEEMAKAAQSSIAADPNFVRGYFRLARAHQSMNDQTGCLGAIGEGLWVDPTNADLLRLRKKEVHELMMSTSPRKTMTAMNDDTLEKLAFHLAEEGLDDCSRGDTVRALKKLEESQETGRAMTNRRRALRIEGTFLGAVASVHEKCGNYEDAIKYNNAALSIAVEMGIPVGEAIQLGSLGGLYSRLGQYSKAVEYRSTALSIRRKIRDLKGERDDLSGLGCYYSEMGKYAEAMECHTRALAISQDSKDRRGEAQDLCNLGKCYRNLGQFTRAVEFHMDALSIEIDIGDRNGQAVTLDRIGLAHSDLGQYSTAIKYYGQSLQIRRDIGDRSSQGSNLCNIGSAFRSLGQYKEAIENQTAALAIIRDSRHRRNEASCLASLGNSYNDLGQHDKAVEFLTSALEISREIGDKQTEAHYLHGLGSSHLFQGNHLEALQVTTEALYLSRDIGDRRSEASSLSNIGAAHNRMKEYREAASNYREALAISREIGDREGEGRHLSNLGTMYSYLGNQVEAIGFLNEALDVYDKIWSDIDNDEHRIAYDDTRMQHSARHLQIVYSKIERHEESLHCAERARCRAFELLLARQRVQSSKSSDKVSATMPSEGSLDVESMRDIAVRQRAAIIMFSKVEGETVVAWVLGSAGGSNLFSKSIHVSREDKSLSQLVELTRRSLKVRARHDAGERSAPTVDVVPIANPTVDEDELYAAAAHAARVSPEVKPNSDEIRIAFAPATSKDVGDLEMEDVEASADAESAEIFSRQDVTASSADLQSITSEKLLRHCHELFIEPLLPALESETRLIIIPDQDLFALPFAALLDHDGRYLIEKFTIQVAPSIGTLVELEKRVLNRDAPNERRLSALLVGDPNFHGRLDQLDGAQKEAREVEQILAKNTVCSPTLLESDDASKATVQSVMPSCDISHLATHGSPDGVYLSGVTEEDGKLTMAEVQDLNLERARLVVLSACDTFKGRLGADGIIGISRAFVAAGAPTLIATLWKVNDMATKAMMSFFYRRLFCKLDGVVDVGVAMQGAMVSMLRHGYEVQEWAPFVVYGLSLDFEPWVSSSEKNLLQLELEDLLTRCRLLTEAPASLDAALLWCKENGANSILKISEMQKESEFAESITQAKIKRKLLVKRIKQLSAKLQ